MQTIRIVSNISDAVDEWGVGNFPGIAYVLVLPDWLVATDGRILAIASAENEEINGIHFLNSRLATPGTVELNGDLWTRKGDNGTFVSMPNGNTESLKYPDVAAVIPKVGDKSVVVQLDAEMLLLLHKALTQSKDCHRLTLILNPEESGVVTKPIAVIGEVGFGVIVPLQPNNGSTPEGKTIVIDRFSNMAASFKRSLAENK